MGLYEEAFNDHLTENNSLTEKDILKEQNYLKNFFFKFNLKQSETTINTSDYFIDPNNFNESKILFNNLLLNSEKKKNILFFQKTQILKKIF